MTDLGLLEATVERLWEQPDEDVEGGMQAVEETIRLEVEADGFLYNMVRAIAGTLMNVGRGYWPGDQVARILAAEDRTQAGPTAPAQGLFLVRVTYEG